MEIRNLFNRVFGKAKEKTPPATATEFTILNDSKAVFTRYNGDYKNDPDVLNCVDTIATNGAKMHPKHIRNYYSKELEKEKIENVKGNLYHILAEQPNELQNAYKFYYQVITELKLEKNSIIYIMKDTNLKVKGLYPLRYNSIKFYEYKDEIWLDIQFARNKRAFVPYSSCIHLTEGTGDDELFGGTNKPLIKVLSIKHILDEGITNAIKTTQNIKGVIKSTKTLLKPEDAEKMRKQFIEGFTADNETGIGAIDSSQEFVPIKLDPKIASDSETKRIDEKILKYFHINEDIIMSKYTEDEWNAFYESVLEPIGLQMSLEFSNKLFTPTEKAFGNKILFESNRLQYASNKTKIDLVRYGGNMFTINEQREMFNLAPIEGGDVLLIDQNHEINSELEGGTDDEGN